MNDFSLYAEGKHECAVFSDAEFAEGATKYDMCKNDHSKYLTVDEFDMSYLPDCYKTPDCTNFIRNAMDRTVRVVISVTSTERPDTYPNLDVPYPCSDIKGSIRRVRTGTGYLFSDDSNFTLPDDLNSLIEKQCPCWSCKRSGKSESFSSYFLVYTSTHVVYDDVEAKSARFEFFYDTEGREEVQVIYGVGVGETDCPRDTLGTDRIQIICVTHDSQLAQRLKKIPANQLPLDPFLPRVPILISHPDGCRKRISIGIFRKIRASISYFPEMTIKLPENKEVRFFDEKINKIEAPPDCSLILRHVGDDTYQLKSDGILIIHANSKVTFSYPIEGEPPTFNHCMLEPGAEIKTSEGECFICHSYMQIEIDVSSFGITCFKNYTIQYDMASCPGSSGARVLVATSNPHVNPLHGHHFGVYGQFKMTGRFGGVYSDDMKMLEKINAF